MPGPLKTRNSVANRVASSAAIVLAGAVAWSVHMVSLLSHADSAAAAMSPGLWHKVVALMGGSFARQGESELANVPFGWVLLVTLTVALVTWLAGAAWITRRSGLSYVIALSRWGRAGWWWWLSALGWELLGVVIDLSGKAQGAVLWRAALPFFHGTIGAGWLTTLYLLARSSTATATESIAPGRIPIRVWVAIVAYFVCFGAMNWLLYEALLLPHGDSAMYEEHVWNLLHGKGFRSYLDQGRLFLGEHIQVIHLAVIPIYVLWPSHLLLELCQSACLAAGAIPVFRIAQRHTGSTRAAACLAIAYLLYVPMQYLDIAITFKTFRPNSFEIPFLLFGLDALERGRLRTLFVWLGLTLLCQEDAATVIAPLGVWIACRHARWAGITEATVRRRLAWLGGGLAVFGVVYVVLVVKVVLPWFRGGEDVHFAKYFEEFGGDSNSIVSSLIHHPGLFLAKLAGVPTWLFALGLVAPLGFLPLLSPGRLAVAAPLFGVLCLSSMTNSPLHHFHAPLVPILIWAAAAGIPQVPALWRRYQSWQARQKGADDDASKHIPPEKFVSSGKTLPAVSTTSASPNSALGTIARRNTRDQKLGQTAAVWCLWSALLTGAYTSLSPLGIGFWDPYSSRFCFDHYVPGERARRFPAVLALVPHDSRVASTDFVHPRFTHHARSYDYSYYRPDVPDDADFIVIDTKHPYSDIKRPEEVKEYRDHPGDWELLEDQTGGYFIVLKRRK
jgi:uncharacterized membrane protein